MKYWAIWQTKTMWSRQAYQRAEEWGGFLKHLNLMAWVRALHCASVYITLYQSMQIPVLIYTSYFMANKTAPVDSGVMDNFMHPNFIA